MAQAKVRVFKLRNQKEEELQKGLNDLKTELSQLRIAKIAGGTAAKIGKIGV
jgi:large subunit ribosomal protein L35e